MWVKSKQNVLISDLTVKRWKYNLASEQSVILSLFSFFWPKNQITQILKIRSNPGAGSNCFQITSWSYLFLGYFSTKSYFLSALVSYAWKLFANLYLPVRQEWLWRSGFAFTKITCIRYTYKYVHTF